MGVIRVEHNDNYTVMSNEHLRDPRLSLRAMGLMSRMLSDTDTWQHSIAGLAAVCKEGRDAVRKTLQELEAAGYLVREQTRKGGSFSSCDYTLYEHSRDPFDTSSGAARHLPLEGKACEDSPLTENPSTVNPTTETPSTVNPTQRNTKSKEVPKEEPPKAPQGGTALAAAGGRERREPGCAAVEKPEDSESPNGFSGTARQKTRREPKEAPDWKPERFAKFWQLYPRGEAKQAAIKAWDALKADDELLIVMGRALLSQMASREWTEGVGIPYAATWLNQRRWTDTSKAPALPPVQEGRRDLTWI